MSKIKRIIIIVLSMVTMLFIVFVIGLGHYHGNFFFFLPPSYDKMDRFLKSNIDELSYVTDAIFELHSELDCDSISIYSVPRRKEDKYDTTMRVRTGLTSENIPIPDELFGHLEKLDGSGVGVISCGRDSVGFSIWSTMDESRGMQYSRTGEKPNSEQLIGVRELSKENWYYYVHNYEKSKERSPHLFQ
jgi:hypothetical protein